MEDDPVHDLLGQVFAPWTKLPDQVQVLTELLVDMQSRLARHERSIKEMRKTMAVTQADLDALAGALNDVSTRLTSADEGLQAEIDALQAANPSLDLSGVQAALANVSAQVDATAAMVPVAPSADEPPAPAE